MAEVYHGDENLINEHSKKYMLFEERLNFDNTRKVSDLDTLSWIYSKLIVDSLHNFSMNFLAVWSYFIITAFAILFVVEVIRHKRQSINREHRTLDRLIKLNEKMKKDAIKQKRALLLQQRIVKLQHGEGVSPSALITELERSMVPQSSDKPTAKTPVTPASTSTATATLTLTPAAKLATKGTPSKAKSPVKVSTNEPQGTPPPTAAPSATAPSATAPSITKTPKTAKSKKSTEQSKISKKSSKKMKRNTITVDKTIDQTKEMKRNTVTVDKTIDPTKDDQKKISNEIV